jgi:hypothetical protein
MSGCTGTGPTGPTTQPSITSTTAITTTMIPTTPVLTSAVPTTQAVTTTPVSYTTNDINKHFVDVAFGPDYSYINKWSKQLVGVAITGAYTNDDVKTLNDFFKLFNSYSSYTKLPSEVKQGDKGEIVLNFLPESSLKNVNSDNSWKISTNHETGTINFIYKTATNQFGGNVETIYINSDLKGDERTHWILRSLLYELGFPGETGTYPDSMFYSESDTATTLSKIDLKALELMYGSKISYGMTLAQVRQLLLINTT